MLAASVCFWTPRLLHVYQGSFMAVHDHECIHTHTAPLFNIPHGRRGTTTKVVNPYARCTCPSWALNLESLQGWSGGCGVRTVAPLDPLGKPSQIKTVVAVTVLALYQ